MSEKREKEKGAVVDTASLCRGESQPPVYPRMLHKNATKVPSLDTSVRECVRVNSAGPGLAHELRVGVCGIAEPLPKTSHEAGSNRDVH